MNRMDDVGKLILRLILGILVLLHGIHKLIYGIEGIQSLVQSVGLPEFVAWAVLIGEVLGPILLIIGWYARIGAALIAINMITAILLVHTGAFLTLNDHGGWALELQGMYLFTAIGLLLTGPGRLSFNRS